MTHKHTAVGTALALIAISLPLAFDLSQAPIQTWDEARQAVNAFEMLRSGGHWLVTTYNHQPAARSLHRIRGAGTCPSCDQLTFTPEIHDCF
jgi:hypothetical protein